MFCWDSAGLILVLESGLLSFFWLLGSCWTSARTPHSWHTGSPSSLSGQCRCPPAWSASWAVCEERRHTNWLVWNQQLASGLYNTHTLLLLAAGKFWFSGRWAVAGLVLVALKVDGPDLLPLGHGPWHRSHLAWSSSRAVCEEKRYTNWLVWNQQLASGQYNTHTNLHLG